MLLDQSNKREEEKYRVDKRKENKMTSSIIQEACEGWKCTEEQISLEGWEYIKRELEKRIRSLKQAKLEQEIYSISTAIGIDARILEREKELKEVNYNIEREKH